jgi:mRNA interferase RelE/StbE
VNYQLILKPSAEKQLRHLASPLQRRIVEKLANVEVQPRTAATKLTGAANTWRIGVGDYRIACEIDDTMRIVYVTIIAHRREVYRGL